MVIRRLPDPMGVCFALEMVDHHLLDLGESVCFCSNTSKRGHRARNSRSERYDEEWYSLHRSGLFQCCRIEYGLHHQASGKGLPQDACAWS